jgi:biopolymer transport protein ExbB/TolQ
MAEEVWRAEVWRAALTAGRARLSKWVNAHPHVVAVAAACLAILLLTFLLPKDGGAARFLLDHGEGSPFYSFYPFTVQNGLHILLALGVGEVWSRWRETQREEGFLARRLLPEEEGIVLHIEDLEGLRRDAGALALGRNSVLPRLIDVTVLQLVTNRSLEQALTVFASTLELISHRIDLAYQPLRYLVWLLPTAGFIGTLIGIAVALKGVGSDADLGQVTSGLAVAFSTTILALIEAAVLALLQNLVQRRQESALTEAAEYCVRNLINRTPLARR